MREIARVADLAEQIRGVTYDKDEASPISRPGLMPILRAGNITDDGLVFDDLVFIPVDRVSNKQKIRRNDIVIAASSGSLDVVGKAARALKDYDGGFGAFCKVLRPGPDVDPSYFSHFFRTPDYRRRISALAAGANINNLRNEHLDEMLIPLPPLPEQRRIAEILDKAETLRVKHRTALIQLDALIQSIFLDMFGDPAKNPNNWRVATIDDCADKALTWNPASKPDDLFQYIDIAAIDQSRKRIIADRELKGAKAPSRARQLVQTGDVLISTVRPNLNAVAVVPPRLDGATVSTGFCVLRPLPDHLTTEYLFALVRSRSFVDTMTRQATGASYPAVTDAMMRVWGAPIPPISLQREYTLRVAAVDRVVRKQEKALEKLNLLNLTLKQLAFQGEL